MERKRVNLKAAYIRLQNGWRLLKPIGLRPRLYWIARTLVYRTIARKWELS